MLGADPSHRPFLFRGQITNPCPPASTLATRSAMTKEVKLKKVLTFATCGGAAYLALHLMGHGAQAWETLRTNVTQQLQLILSMGTAGVFALLIPKIDVPAPQPHPPKPSERPPASDVDEPQYPFPSTTV